MAKCINPFDVKYVELYCKLNILWWLEVYNPEEWRIHGPYFTIDVNKQKGWYFDMGPGDSRTGGDKKLYSVGLSGESPEDFYWLYKFDPEVKQVDFIESNWNKIEFELLIKDYARRGDLEELCKSLAKIKTRSVREVSTGYC